MDYFTRWLLLFLLLVLPFTMLFSQQERLAAIIGQVNDAESGTALENAIVFLSNTPLGTSTNKDGKFILMNTPLGEYELVVSRVGYERQTFPIKLEKPESLSFNIKLKPEPVKTKGMDVVGERAEGAREALGLFFPGEIDNAYCVYGTVSSLPIGVLFTDSAIYMYSLDTAVVDSAKYIRLWLLYKNLSEMPFELNPAVFLRLNVHGKNKSYNNIPPTPPSQILDVVPKDSLSREISDKVEKTIMTLLLWQELIKPGYIRIMNGSIDAKQGTDADRSGKMRIQWNFQKDQALEGTSSEYLSGIFQNSINVGILGRYTVYPNNSVNGFVYFPFPGLNWKATGSWFREAAEYVYELELRLPSGTKIITFRPN